MVSTNQDMLDAEDRDAWGFQYRHGPVTRPGRIDVRAPISGEFKPDNSIGKTTNPALPWLTSIMAGAAFGGMLIFAILKPWETADRAAQAESEARMANRMAKVEEGVGVAKYEASIAKNTAQKLEAKLNVR